MILEKLNILRLSDIRPEDFYGLIKKNKDHIRATFPKTLSGCADLEKTYTFIEKARVNEINNENYYFYIQSKEDQALIGYVCVKNINTDISKCELAYFADIDFQGKGIISTVVSEILDFCFNEIMMNKIFICTSKTNLASQGVALKLGFRKEGILKEEFRNWDGELEDIVYFGLLKSEHSER